MSEIINYFDEIDDEFLMMLALSPRSLQQVCIMVSLDMQLQLEDYESISDRGSV